MENIKTVNNASFAYSINLLQMLWTMKLITNEEYEKIVKISAKHYETNLIYV